MKSLSQIVDYLTLITNTEIKVKIISDYIDYIVFYDNDYKNYVIFYSNYIWINSNYFTISKTNKLLEFLNLGKITINLDYYRIKEESDQLQYFMMYFS